MYQIWDKFLCRSYPPPASEGWRGVPKITTIKKLKQPMPVTAFLLKCFNNMLTWDYSPTGQAIEFIIGKSMHVLFPTMDSCKLVAQVELSVACSGKYISLQRVVTHCWGTSSNCLPHGVRFVNCHVLCVQQKQVWPGFTSYAPNQIRRVLFPKRKLTELRVKGVISSDKFR